MWTSAPLVCCEPDPLACVSQAALSRADHSSLLAEEQLYSVVIKCLLQQRNLRHHVQFAVTAGSEAEPRAPVGRPSLKPLACPPTQLLIDQAQPAQQCVEIAFN